jgi:hypothetical protein
VSPPEPWDDGLADVVALVIAARAEDVDAVRVVLRYGDTLHMLATAAVLLGRVLGEQGISDEWFREWARCAVRRPG